MFDSGLDQLSKILKSSFLFIEKIVSEFFLRKKNNNNIYNIPTAQWSILYNERKTTNLRLSDLEHKNKSKVKWLRAQKQI